MPKKRGNGEGSIYRRKDGLWVGQYGIGTDEGPKTKYVYSKKRAEVAKRLASAIAERDKGLMFDSESLTLEGYLSGWLESVEGTIGPRTYERYEQSCRLHVNPLLGRTRLDGLKAVQLQGLYRKKLDSGLSPRTVQIIHATLHKALDQGVKWRLIPMNIAKSATPPRARKKEIKPLNPDQSRKLRESAKGDELEALYVLALTTGMRQGELLGLRWEDVDLEGAILGVNRTVFEGVAQPPKTAKGRRSIRLGREAVGALRAHPRTGEWVFSSKSGSPLNRHNLHNRHWKPLLRRAELPDIRFHDLRHTCATLLLTKGVHPKVIQELLGHSSISVTLDTYSHVLPNMQGAAADAMDDLF